MRTAQRSVASSAIPVVAACLAVAIGFAAQVAAQASPPTVFAIESPRAGATVYGIVQVKGYVLDDRGVSNITLLVDDVPVHDADISQPRPDVLRKYPAFAGEPFPVYPGFSTSFLAANYADGPHTVAILVTYADYELADGDMETEAIGERTINVDNTINQPPVGALDSPRDPNAVNDDPYLDPFLVGMNDYVSGVYPITGWAIDDQGIRTTVAYDGSIRAGIDVLVDSRVIGQSIYPLPRPDVANAYPDVPDALDSGFQMNLDTTRITNGMHRLQVRAWDTLGKSRILGTRDVWIDNYYPTLKPFGKIDWPMPNGHIYSRLCGTPPKISPAPPADNTDHNDWVAGWVIDQNDQTRFQGVKYVELLLDGVLLSSTSRDCVYEGTVFFQNVNCYGFERPDILSLYPQFPADAKDSGFFFALNAKNLLDEGLHKGLHYLSVRVGDMDPTRPPVIIDTIPVILQCNENLDEPSFGDIESPKVLEDLTGSVTIKGWVVDINGGTKQLNFYVDGILDGSLIAPNPNILMPRPDIAAKFPWIPYAYAYNSGFQYTLDTSKYEDGVHQLVIESYDFSNFHNYWVQRGLTFNNTP
jgi:hypothetical protein